jgi:hypothetical protein
MIHFSIIWQWLVRGCFGGIFDSKLNRPVRSSRLNKTPKPLKSLVLFLGANIGMDIALR